MAISNRYAEAVEAFGLIWKGRAPVISEGVSRIFVTVSVGELRKPETKSERFGKV
jgi:hypothetical protein